MAYDIIRPTTHNQWLSERSKGIGSSEAGTLMGVNPFSTPYDLWLQKTGRKGPTEETEAMFNGHVFELSTAEWFAKTTGATIDPTSVGDWIARNREIPYLQVSPDRIYWDKDLPEKKRSYANASILELKSTSHAVDRNDVPGYWYCQLQYQMGVMGLTHGSLCWVSANPTLHFDYAPIKFNPTFYNVIIERITRFWNDYILKDVAPESINGDDCLVKFPKVDKNSQAAADQEAYDEWLALKRCRSRIKELKEEEDLHADAVKTALERAEELTFTDPQTGRTTVLATWKNGTKKVLDIDRLKNEDPDLWLKHCKMEPVLDEDEFQQNNPEGYAKYLKSITTTRKFLVK